MEELEKQKLRNRFQLENEIIELMNDKNKMTTSDFQGCIGGIVNKIKSMTLKGLI